MISERRLKFVIPANLEVLESERILTWLLCKLDDVFTQVDNDSIVVAQGLLKPRRGGIQKSKLIESRACPSYAHEEHRELVEIGSNIFDSLWKKSMAFSKPQM